MCDSKCLLSSHLRYCLESHNFCDDENRKTIARAKTMGNPIIKSKTILKILEILCLHHFSFPSVFYIVESICRLVYVSVSNITFDGFCAVLVYFMQQIEWNSQHFRINRNAFMFSLLLFTSLDFCFRSVDALFFNIPSPPPSLLSLLRLLKHIFLSSSGVNTIFAGFFFWWEFLYVTAKLLKICIWI